MLLPASLEFQELAVIQSSIGTESFKKIPFASRLPSSALITAVLLLAVMIGVTISQPHKASVVPLGSASLPVPETTKIVPADALGSPAAWSPLTGDGSN